MCELLEQNIIDYYDFFASVFFINV